MAFIRLFSSILISSLLGGEIVLPPKTSSFIDSQFHEMGIRLKGSGEAKGNGENGKSSERRCKSLVYRSLTVLPKSHVRPLKDLTLKYNTKDRRGLGGNRSIVLRCLGVSDNELVSVLTHEIGHIVDANFLIGKSEIKSSFMDFDIPVPADDPSVLFYSLSWRNDRKLKKGASKLDFVSGYAMNDPFEDFAETYIFYRLHGKEFRDLADESEVLRKKYEFMKTYIFDGGEFETGDTAIASVRNYDSTILPFDLDSFLRL